MPLPQGSEATVESIVEAWQPLVKQFKTLSDRYGKPFILTEVGYCSGRECLPDHHDTPRGEREQAIHYEALLRVIRDNSEWFHGVFFWNWITDSAFGEPSDGNKCMDPKWKQAEQVLRKYYNATQPAPVRIIEKKPECICIL